MNDNQKVHILSRLTNDYSFKKSEDGRWLNQGSCPKCRKKSLFIATDNPYVMRCGRENKCGATWLIKDLYPEEFCKFNERYPANVTNPNETADAYMREARGLNVLMMKDYYVQGLWENRYNKKETATVRFEIPLTNGAFMERFVEEMEIEDEDGSVDVRKCHFNGAHAGCWWLPPDMEIQSGDEVWITEGIIDAISLWQHKIKAVAILSCSNYPEKSLNNLKIAHTVNWVWALDNDKAGKSAIIKFVKKMRDHGMKCDAAISSVSEKNDWNDLHLKGRLEEKDIENYRYSGGLLIAESAVNKAALIFAHSQSQRFILDFNNQLYWFSIDAKDFVAGKEEANASLTEKEQLMAIAKKYGLLYMVANVRPEFLYFQRNEVTDESWYYCRVHFPDGRQSINLTFTPSQITTSSEFKKRLAHAPGAWWSGDAKHLNYIGSRDLQKIKIVETIDYLGYSSEHNVYIFPKHAVFKGKIYTINEEDFFDLPNNKSVKSLIKDKNIKLAATPKNYEKNWAQLVWKAFGTNGIIACVYWFGSLFVQQIRQNQSSFPFLEIIGEPGSGKTTLIEFLWKLFGQDREGIDPNKATSAGLDRSLTQYANMPNVFIEADRAENSHSKKFDWDELKPFYNGRGMKVRGVKNCGNETRESLFRGSLVIAQNDQISASDAVLERIVQLKFMRCNHNSESRHAADVMIHLSIEQLSYFALLAVQQADSVVDYIIKKMPEYQDNLLKDNRINHMRLAKNHAQLIALTEKFSELVGLTQFQKDTTCNALKQACIERESEIAADHHIVAEFWDMFDYIEQSALSNEHDNYQSCLNHSRDKNIIAVNLNEFVERASCLRQQVPELALLKKLLKTSKKRKFIEASRTVSSAIAFNKNNRPKTPRCWIFEKEKQFRGELNE